MCKLPQNYINNIKYDEFGSRTYFEYGNGVSSAYIYNSATRRLQNLSTTATNGNLHNLTYTYDPVGNITRISNAATGADGLRGSFTKHYFIAGQKIASKLGEGFSNSDELAALKGEPIAPLYGEYEELGKLQTDRLRRDFDCLGVNYDHFSPGKPSFELLEAAEQTEIGEESNIYFYHSDHLGSCSFLTDGSGFATQHLQYLPFGEDLVHQQNTAAYYTPYSFSGKERDFETGLSYFGARYYDAGLSIWLSVDPMSDKYPSLSAYNYCAWNPVMLVDPDGRTPFPSKLISDYCFNTIKANYNKDGQSILKKKDSSLGYLANTTPRTNTCAIRMSEALNLSGYYIPKAQETDKNVRVQNGRNEDSGNFILDAVSMGNYLSSIEKPTHSFNNLNTREKIDEAMKQLNSLGDINGIIVLTAGNQQEFGATGHVDLLYNDFWGDLSMYGSGNFGVFNDLDDYLNFNLEANLSIQIWIIPSQEGGNCD